MAVKKNDKQDAGYALDNQEEIAQSRDELLFAINAAELATWDLNPVTFKFSGNNRLREWLGLTHDQEVDLSVATNAIAEKDRARVSEAIQYAMQFSSGGIYNIEYTIVNAISGVERTVLARGKALFDDRQVVTRFNGILQDITEEKAARSALVDAEERARLAADAVDLGTYDMNLITGVMMTSARFDAIFGFDRKVARSKFVGAIHPDDLGIRVNAHRRSVETGRLFYEVRVVWPNSELHWIRVEGKIYYNDSIRPVRIIGTVLDISDRKFAEEELLQINKRLEQALEEQKELQRQKDDFIGIASHELKTPVTSIKAYTQVLAKILNQKGDVREAGMMQKMDAQLNRLTSLIGDLLDVTKMNSGRLQFNDAHFNFLDMLNFVIEDLQRTTERHTLIQDFENVGSVFADQERIGQVLTNLISNAIKYSPGATEINISCSVENDEVVVRVKDHGIGIPEDKLSRVFEQFYRVSGNMQHTFPGLGLGLYISSEIIKREGGNLWATSVEGEGSTFCFSLPLSR